ncbi:MAG: hypothetical protein GX245_01430 [Eubacteriaceae bacterium]|nr:hypothetical protein [Eubacteriaceae bacterium]
MTSIGLRCLRGAVNAWMQVSCNAMLFGVAVAMQAGYRDAFYSAFLNSQPFYVAERKGIRFCYG